MSPVFGTSGKLVCDCLLVNNSQLILSCTVFVMADYCSSFCCGQEGVPVFNALIQDEPLSSALVKFGLKKLETSLSHPVQNIFCYLEPYRHDSRM